MSGLTVITVDGIVIPVPIEIESAGGDTLNGWVADRAAALRQEAAAGGAPPASQVAPAAGDEEGVV